MTAVRSAAVAGLFYPSEPDALEAEIRRCLPRAERGAGVSPAPKALLLPHAGYDYSGPVAGSGYALLRGSPATRVVLVGPSHRVHVRGIALSSASTFETPLGHVPLRSDPPMIPHSTICDRAHQSEHSLEVHLPFLQRTLRDFELLPMLIGEASAEEVAEALDAVWGGPETVIIVSSDLSHYHDVETARRLDRATAAAIVALRAEEIGDESACGCRAVRGLLLVARRRGLRARLLDLRNSDDAIGGRADVVGYGAFAFSE